MFMAFNGFEQKDFDTFHIEGLDERMTAIQERIQPKFKQIGDVRTDDVSAMVGSEMHLHIAKHARRTVNPPNDTWMAIAGNKRGYKKHPHFQVGLWDDLLFLWLAFIYELLEKTKIARNLQYNNQLIEELPDDYVISLDHMKNEATQLNEIDLDKALTRFHDVKKAEFLIGRHLKPNDPTVQQGEAFMEFARSTFERLIPLYRLAYQ